MKGLLALTALFAFVQCVQSRPKSYGVPKYRSNYVADKYDKRDNYVEKNVYDDYGHDKDARYGYTGYFERPVYATKTYGGYDGKYDKSYGQKRVYGYEEKKPMNYEEEKEYGDDYSKSFRENGYGLGYDDTYKSDDLYDDENRIYKVIKVLVVDNDYDKNSAYGLDDYRKSNEDLSYETKKARKMYGYSAEKPYSAYGKRPSYARSSY